MRTCLAALLLLQAAGVARSLEDTPGDLRRVVELLSSAELGGRMAGSEGERLAAALLERELEASGALPLPGQQSMLLPFEFTAGVRDTGSSLRLQADDGSSATWSSGEDLRALSFSSVGAVSGDVVFAGYGLRLPEDEDLPYDSYAGLDVENKIVLVLRYFPEDADQGTRSLLSRFAGLRYKAMHARDLGAIGLLVATGPRSPNAGKLVPMTFDTAISGSGIAAASVSGAVAEHLLAAAGRSLEETQKSLDTANPHVSGFGISGVEVTLDVSVERERRQGFNVVSHLPPTTRGPGTPQAALPKPWILLGAHYDHLGTGGHGSSLARQEETGQIHPGADDNASGVVGLLAATSRLATASRERSVVIAFWSGEELGLQGSSDFVDREILDPAEIAACLNLDMVGRMEDNRLVLQGVGSSPVWPRLVEQTNVPLGFDLQLQGDPYLPSDSTSFNRVEVPCLTLFTGGHGDYHRPSDTAEKLNYDDMGRVARFVANLAGRLANLETTPEFTRIEREPESGPRRDAVRAYTGTIPDYTTEAEGLRLADVVAGGPAEEAGLRGGDVIVRFGSQTIVNVYDYTFALEAVKIGEPVEVEYLRDGESRTTTLVPRARP